MLQQLTALRLSRADWIFSIKAFVSAMLALYVAFRFDLPKPAWAMATAYIVANPLSGAVTSKAIYRVLGTIIGAVVAVLLVPNLANARELLCLLLAAWVGMCLYISLLDRTPRSYVSMLAGFTAAIIGFASVADPASTFETAVARVEEITVGILCATLVHRIVFPRHVASVVAHRIEGWMQDIRRLALDSFAGDGENERIQRDRDRLTSDIRELHSLSIHLAYEPTELQEMTGPMHALQARMALLVPTLYAIEDRLVRLKREGKTAWEDLQSLLQKTRAWTQNAASIAGADALHAEINQRQKAVRVAGAGASLLEFGILHRLRRFIQILAESQALWSDIRAGEKEVPEGIPQRAVAGVAALHRDHWIAARYGLGAMLSVLISCATWIATGWPEGATAAQMAAVGACILANTDNPLSNLLGFIQYTLLSVGAVFLYNFAILPSVDGFPSLVLVLAPYFLVLGVLLSVPPLYGFALPMIANGALLLDLQSEFSAVFAPFANNTIATVLGLTFPAMIIAFLGSSGAEHAIDRLLAAGRDDVWKAVRDANPLSRDTLARRMLDRIGLLIPLARDPAMRKSAVREASNDYIVGVNVADLRRLSISLAGSTQRAVTGAVAAIGEVYAPRKSAPTAHCACALSEIDAALGAVDAASLPMSTHDEALVALFEIRLALFPDAPPLTTRGRVSQGSGVDLVEHSGSISNEIP